MMIRTFRFRHRETSPRTPKKRQPIAIIFTVAIFVAIMPAACGRSANERSTDENTITSRGENSGAQRSANSQTLDPNAVDPQNPSRPENPILPMGENARTKLAEMQASAERRELSTALESGFVDPDQRIRRAAYLSIARFHDPRHLERLRRGLRDSDPGVRANASLGIAALVDALNADAPENRETSANGENPNDDENPTSQENSDPPERGDLVELIMGALAAEDDSRTEAWMIRDLGRLHDRRALPIIYAAMARVEDPPNSPASSPPTATGVRAANTGNSRPETTPPRTVDLYPDIGTEPGQSDEVDRVDVHHRATSETTPPRSPNSAPIGRPRSSPPQRANQVAPPGGLSSETTPPRTLDSWAGQGGGIETSDSGRIRAAACLALAEFASHPGALRVESSALGSTNAADAGIPSTVSMRNRAASMLAPAQEVDVRRACTYALSRFRTPSHDPGVESGLGLATGDADSEVRAYAYRALSHHAAPDLRIVMAGLEDSNWRVVTESIRAMGRISASREDGASLMVRVLDTVYRRYRDPRPSEGPSGTSGDEVSETGTSDVGSSGGQIAETGSSGAGSSGNPAISPPSLHPLLTAFRTAAPHARVGPMHDLASSIHSELGRRSRDEAMTRDRGLAHCAAAALVDRGRGWPSRVENCGLEQVQSYEQAILRAEILADVEGAEMQRMAFLRRLYRNPDPRVREAVLRAVGTIAHSEATDLLVRALHARSGGVLATSLENLKMIAERRPAPGEAPAPFPTVRVVDGMRAAGIWLSEDSRQSTELETWLMWVDLAQVLEAHNLGPRLLELTRSPHPLLRQKASILLTRWFVDIPPSNPPPIPNPISSETLAQLPARTRVLVETDRGSIVIELRADAAPTTVARFLELVRSGFYNDLTFHRVVSSFVVQGGDPQADGYGGPGYWQRCEDNRLPYERGVVGMALAGRDTGGSQFFIVHGNLPHLDFRYTAFGRVVEGMDVVDRLQAADVIRSIALQ